MRVISLPSVYDQERARAPKPSARRHWTAALAGAAASLTAAGIVRGEMAVPLAALAVSWMLCVGFTWLINSGRPMGQGEIGERTALRELARSPLLAADEYVAIANCRVPGYEQIGDLDIVVIGPPGIVVIEVKNFLRPMRVNGEMWVAESAQGAAPIKSVSRQLDNEVRALAKCLARSGAATPAHGLIAINGNAVLQIESPPIYPVAPYPALAGAIAGLPASSQSVPLEAIVSLLAPGSAAQPQAGAAEEHNRRKTG